MLRTSAPNTGRLKWHSPVLVLMVLAGLTSLPIRAAAPAHDNVIGAVEALGFTFALAADLAEATREPFEPSHPNKLGQSVWWRWTALQEGLVGWDTSASANPVDVSVLTLDGLAQWKVLTETYLRPIAVGGFSFGGPSVAPDPRGSFPVAAGTTYWIRLDGVQTNGTSLISQEPLPPSPRPVSASFEPILGTPASNDRFSSRKVMDLASPAFEASLAMATSEPGEPRAHESSACRTLWWTWTAPSPGTARIRILDTHQAPLVVAYRRTTFDKLDSIASSATELGNECTRFWHARAMTEWDTQAGESYFLQVDAFPGFDRSQPFHAQLEFTPAPANDLLSAPVEITGEGGSWLASNEGATGSPLDPVAPGLSGTSSLWYRWLLPNSGLIQITTNEPTRFAEPGVEVLPPGGLSTGGSITTTYLGPCGAEFTDLHPIPTFAPIFSVFRRLGTSGDLPILQHHVHGTNEVWAEVTDSEVWIRMDGPESTTGRAQLNAHLTPPPANDLWSQRIILPTSPVRVTGRTAGASALPEEALLAAQSLPGGITRLPRQTVWWEWQAPAAGIWALRTTTMTDSAIAVYRGAYAVGSIPIAVAEIDPALFRAEPGEVFHIGGFGFSGFGGNLEFRIQEASVPPLTQPTLQIDGAGKPWWNFTIPVGWDLPFEAETSLDLRTWNIIPFETGWTPRFGGFRLAMDAETTHSFFRLRIRTP